MGFLKFVLFAAVLGGAGHYAWKSYHERSAMAQATSDSGFVRIAPVDGTSANTVLILAPENCPSEQARHATELAERLTRMGIPFKTGSTMAFSDPGHNPTADEIAAMDRGVAIFNQGAPMVFVNDMAKSNPTAEEVAYEFKRARSRQ